MNPQAMEEATAMAQAVYESFLQNVLVRHVLNDRARPLGVDKQTQIDKGTHISGIPLRLMTLSGKGGWHTDPKRRASYAANSNVTLLDHLLSVTRGAVMLASLDWFARNPTMGEKELAKTRQKLTLIAVLGFLHDADKDLFSQSQAEAGQTSREIELIPADIDKLAEKYGITEFLHKAGMELDGAQLLYLLEKAESTQANRHLPAMLPPREFERPVLYVRLADKLDGIWLSADKTDSNGKLHRGGLAGVLERLAADEILAEGSWLRDGWKAVDIFDPHHPFLLDELQRWLTHSSFKLGGVLPLIETHQDGRLFMLLPAELYDAIVERGLKFFCKNLPFNQLRYAMGKGGGTTISLYDARPVHEELKVFVERLSAKSASDILCTKAALHSQPDFLQRMDDLLGPVNLAPRLSGNVKDSGLATLYVRLDGLDDSRLRSALHASLLMNLLLSNAPKDVVPNPAAREREVLSQVEVERPDWISAIEDDYSRRVITALWAVRLAADDSRLSERIWGDEGLLKIWLEGTTECPGFNQFISGRGAQVSTEARRHFEQLLHGGRVFPESEDKRGRCIFTDEPVCFEDAIDSQTDLYGVKASAFSGRDNRPESLTNDQHHTNVSLVSQAEHRLRYEAYAQEGGKLLANKLSLPILISSPITVGLFGGLGLHTDSKGIRGLSLYDLSRQETKKGKVYEGLEMYSKRYRMARLEEMPTRLSSKTTGKTQELGQLQTVRMMLQACLRLGRPMHIFRGLPTFQRAFFYYDAMPRLLAELLKDLSDGDGRSLRLEQIQLAIKRLSLAQDLLDTPGLGYEVLRLFGDPRTRLGAVCLALCYFRDLMRGKPEDKNAKKWKKTIEKLHVIYQEETEMLDDSNNAALIELGRLAAGIQKYVTSNDSTNKQMLVFNICLNTLNVTRSLGQCDEASLIAAMTGELEMELTRKGDTWIKNSEKLLDSCRNTAEWFVHRVWAGVMKGHAPSQRQRRILGSIYRVAFLQAVRKNAENKEHTA